MTRVAGTDTRELANISQSVRRRASKTSVVIAVDLANFIMSRDLPDGASLPNEKDMADELGVGRASIREALRLLETRGLIRIRSGPGGGPTVRRPEPSEFASAVEFALQVERAQLAEVLRAREDLSPFAARLAATRAGADQVKAMRVALDLLRSDLTNDATFSLQGRHFEALVAEAGGNVVVRLMADALVAILWDTIPHIEYPLTRRRAVVRSLEQVFHAIEARDPDEAERSMSRYVRNGTRYWRKSYPDLMSRSIRWTG
jgi:GntR family transcriptional regulator, transcriptional repressor for pyruvate dehydrogenase complex